MLCVRLRLLGICCLTGVSKIWASVASPLVCVESAESEAVLGDNESFDFRKCELFQKS